MSLPAPFSPPPTVAVLYGGEAVPAASVRAAVRAVRQLRQQLARRGTPVRLRCGPGFEAALVALVLGGPSEDAPYSGGAGELGEPCPSAFPTVAAPEPEGWFAGAAALVLLTAEPHLEAQVAWALEHGIPVVAPDLPRTRDWLGAGGVLLPGEEYPSRAAEALGRLLGDPAEREALRRRGRAQARRLRRRAASVAERRPAGAGMSLTYLPPELTLSVFEGGRRVAQFHPDGRPLWEKLEPFAGVGVSVLHRETVEDWQPDWLTVPLAGAGRAYLAPGVELPGAEPSLPEPSVRLQAAGSLPWMLSLLPWIRELHSRGWAVCVECSPDYLPLFQHDPAVRRVLLPGAAPVPPTTRTVTALERLASGSLLDGSEGLDALHETFQAQFGGSPEWGSAEPSLAPEVYQWGQTTLPSPFVLFHSGTAPVSSHWVRTLAAGLPLDLYLVSLTALDGDAAGEVRDLSHAGLPQRLLATLRATAVLASGTWAAVAERLGVPTVRLEPADNLPDPAALAAQVRSIFAVPEDLPTPLFGVPPGCHVQVVQGPRILAEVAGGAPEPLAETLVAPAEDRSPTARIPESGADLLLRREGAGAPPPSAVRRRWLRSRLWGTDFHVQVAPDVPFPWDDPCPAAGIRPVPGEDPEGTLHVLCPSGIGDFLWIWRKFWKVAAERPVRFWFAAGEQQRAGGYAELVGARCGYLPRLETDWVWSRPGSPPLPEGGGWVTVQANRHLEAGHPLADWYPELPLGTPEPALPPAPPADPYAYVFVGRRDYMEGNLPPATWARLLRRIETVMPVKVVGAGIDGEWIREVLREHGGNTVEVLLDRPLREVLTAARDARLVFGLAGGPTIAALCLGAPSVLGYPRWLHRMPGTWEPEGTTWDWCFVSELERKLEWLLSTRALGRLASTEPPGREALPEAGRC